MSRYFFHVHNHSGDARDEEGREVDSIETARHLAIEDIRSIIGEEVLKGFIDLDGHIEITNDAGECVLTVPYDDAIELRASE